MPDGSQPAEYAAATPGEIARRLNILEHSVSELTAWKHTEDGFMKGYKTARQQQQEQSSGAGSFSFFVGFMAGGIVMYVLANRIFR